MGLASSSTKMRRGGELSIRRRGWCSQILNALALNLSNMNWRSIGRFSGTGAHGRVTGLFGGSSRRGHEQGSLVDVGTPEFEHVVGFGGAMAVREATGASMSHKPTDGNDFGTSPRSMQAESDKNVVVTCLDT